MTYIYNNFYLKSFKFSSYQERAIFLKNQSVENISELEEPIGDFYYCYIGYHSLTQQKKFVLSFSSDCKDDGLMFLAWNENLFLINTGHYVYFIDHYGIVKFAYTITTPVVGFYTTDKNNLLMLEDAALKLFNEQGEILKDEIFDLIQDFSIIKNQLFIKTHEEKNLFFNLE